LSVNQKGNIGEHVRILVGQLSEEAAETLDIILPPTPEHLETGQAPFSVSSNESVASLHRIYIST